MAVISKLPRGATEKEEPAVMVTIYGAALETITSDGKEICTTDANGEGTAVLNVGQTYTLIGGVSGYEKTVTVQSMPNEKESRLPEGYSELEYIESTGTQYIDSGYSASNKSLLTVEVESASTNTDKYNPLFGSRKDWGSNGFMAGLHDHYNSYTDALCYGDLTARIGSDSQDGNYHKYKLSGNKWYVDDVLLYTFETNSTTPTQSTIYINTFSQTPTAYENYGYHRFKSVKILYDNILIRNFVPCRRNFDNEVGLYDLVTNTFYSNSGTGSFIGGKRVDIPCVKVMPDGALYWYGYGIEAFDGGYEAISGIVTKESSKYTVNLNSITIPQGRTSTDMNKFVRTLRKYNPSELSKFSIMVEATSVSGGNSDDPMVSAIWMHSNYGSSWSRGNFGRRYVSEGSTEHSIVLTCDVAEETSNGYLSAVCDYAIATVYAMWLE